jgi:hypothetical protein
MQERLVRKFHYALGPFLGPSEVVTPGAHLFEPVGAKHRLFQWFDTANATRFPDFRSPDQSLPAATPLPSARLTDRIEKIALAALDDDPDSLRHGRADPVRWRGSMSKSRS